ncbi:MAG: IgGFc-binding protein [Candidatus Azobacteroides sp.]|nr:IgGFc-binding protein [Candidatus Azobacteroides sp.]
MRKNIAFYLTALCLFVCFCTNIHAQQDTRGKDFWIAFGPNNGQEASMEVRIVALKACTVTLLFTEDNSSHEIHMAENEIITYALDDYQKELVTNDASGTSNKSLKITSTEDVFVYAFNQARSIAEAASVFPIESYGVRYYIMSYSPYYYNEVYFSYDSFLLIAEEDGTNIFLNNSPQPVTTLSKGEVYCHLSDLNEDLTGTFLRASRPVACFVVNHGTNIPVGYNAVDNLFEQMVSVDKWGKEFFVPVTDAGIEIIRIIASEDNTTVTLKTLTGDNTHTINVGEFVEEFVRHSEAGAYITSDLPVAVCSYMVGWSYPEQELILNGRNSIGDPALAWISPIEQMLNESMNLAAYVSQGQTSVELHYAILVVKTSDKNSTQWKTNINETWATLTGVWTDHHSGYSYIRVKLDETLNYTFYNPEGMLVWGYGYGEAESYYYQVGCTFKEINRASEFFVNEVAYDHIDGKQVPVCDDILLEAVIEGDVDTSWDYLYWYIDDIEDTTKRNIHTWSTSLTKGTHKIEMEVVFITGQRANLSCEIEITDNILTWNPAAEDNNWNNPSNWLTVSGGISVFVPEYCTDVYIPGNASNYPSLDTTNTPRDKYGDPLCNRIYFHFGGEVAKPQLLTYKQAFIQYNVGYYDGNTYKTDGDAYSATPLVRNRWYALAAPLKKIASGDFSLGGYPFTYQMLFSSSDGNSGDSDELEGSWTMNDMTNGYELGTTSNYAITLLVDHHEYGILGKEDHSNLNALKGIIEIPYFENQSVSDRHRIHSYNATEGYSTFRYFYHGKDGFPFSTRTPDTLYRADEAYRFVFEDDANNPLDPFPITVPAGKEVMIGNPFVSSLDFDKLYEANTGKIESSFKLYENHQFQSYDYHIGPNPLFDNYIAPLQAFFLSTIQPGNTVDISFPSEASVTRPENEPLQLKTTGSKYQPDILFFLAENGTNQSMVTLALNKENGENSKKMFISHEENLLVPQLYIMDNNRPTKNDIQYIFGEEATLQMGIKCITEEEMKLRVINTEKLSTSDLVLYDKKLNKEIDFYQENTYSFTHDPGMEERFEIRIKNIGSLSSIKENPDAGKNKLVRVFYRNGILSVTAGQPVEKIMVYDIQGKKIVSEPAHSRLEVETMLPLSAAGIYICEVSFSGNASERHKFMVTIF